MKTFHFVTIFPDLIKTYMNESILGRAQKMKKISAKYYDPRDFTKDPHRRIDDKPYGGGPGMLMQVGPIIKAVASAVGRKKNVKIIILSPNGKKFTNKEAVILAKKHDNIVFISGRYEGIDARVKKILRATEYSIGDYVLTGGELPSLVLADSITRQIPGVLGCDTSLEEGRYAGSAVYTRPEILKFKDKEYKVPKVLLSGDHKKIEDWRKKNSPVWDDTFKRRGKNDVDLILE